MNGIVIKNISIGDELLIGQVINTNAAWLGEHLSDAGFQLDSALTIGDSEKAILDAFNACMDADLVLVTGGLGPTTDDITKPTVCKFFETELEFCQEAYDNIVSLFNRRGFQMSDRNRGQAMLPKACQYIPNTYGTAPCMWLEKKGVVFVFMPGVPFEMKGIFSDVMNNYSGNETVNAGTGKELTIKELTELVAKVIGYTGQINWDTTRPNGTPRKLLDVSKAEKLGWRYKTELEDGIRLAYDDFLNNPMRAER